MSKLRGHKTDREGEGVELLGTNFGLKLDGLELCKTRFDEKGGRLRLGKKSVSG